MTFREITGEIPSAVQTAIATSEAMGAPPFEPFITATLNPGAGLDNMNQAPILIRSGDFNVGVLETASKFKKAGFTVYMSFEAETDYRRFRQIWIKAGN